MLLHEARVRWSFRGPCIPVVALHAPELELPPAGPIAIRYGHVGHRVRYRPGGEQGRRRARGISLVVPRLLGDTDKAVPATDQGFGSHAFKAPHGGTIETGGELEEAARRRSTREEQIRAHWLKVTNEVHRDASDLWPVP